MTASPTIFFMAPKGALQDWFWREPSITRAKELGYEVRLNPAEGKLTSEEWAEALADVDALLTTWGTPRLDEAVLARNPNLKIVGHVGGSVAHIVSPYLFERGAKVCTANRLMARSVAEWCLMMTFVGLRHPLDYMQFGAAGELKWANRKERNVVPKDAVIGIWGYGDVARQLVGMLRPFGPKEIIVCSGYLSETNAAAEGVHEVPFDELFERSDVIHCLESLRDDSKGRIGPAQLAAIKDGAALLNCGRAALIQEDALIRELRKNRFTAIMDVFETEPPAADHPYRSMPNVILTPHNAGAGRDAHYIGAMLDEFHRFFNGEPLQHEVSRDRALTMTDPSKMRERA